MSVLMDRVQVRIIYKQVSFPWNREDVDSSQLFSANLEHSLRQMCRACEGNVIEDGE